MSALLIPAKAWFQPYYQLDQWRRRSDLGTIRFFVTDLAGNAVDLSGATVYAYLRGRESGHAPFAAPGNACTLESGGTTGKCYLSVTSSIYPLFMAPEEYRIVLAAQWAGAGLHTINDDLILYVLSDT